MQNLTMFEFWNYNVVYNNSYSDIVTCYRVTCKVLKYKNTVRIFFMRKKPLVRYVLWSELYRSNFFRMTASSIRPTIKISNFNSCNSWILTIPSSDIKLKPQHSNKTNNLLKSRALLMVIHHIVKVWSLCSCSEQINVQYKLQLCKFGSHIYPTMIVVSLHAAAQPPSTI